MHVDIVVAKAVTVVLGLAIAWQAYRGWRRHGSRPMAYVAAGFVVISVGSVLESVFIDVAGWSLHHAGIVQSALVAVGMVLILYALHGGSVE